MTAGTGVTHSEFNHSQSEPVHLLQIWILPSVHGLSPGYEQKKFPLSESKGKLNLVASPNGRDGSVTIHQDVLLYTALLDSKDQLLHKIPTGRHAWIQLVRGDVAVNGESLTAGDGAAVSEERELNFSAKSPAEFLVFELA